LADWQIKAPLKNKGLLERADLPLLRYLPER
jgi:hypothetical protein